MVPVVLMYAILASTFTIAKEVIGHAKPFFIIGARMTLAGVAFLLFAHFFNGSLSIKRKDWGKIFQVSLFNIYLAFIPEFWSLQYLTSTKVVFIYSITPFIAAIFAYFFANERLSGQKALGMVIGFLGMAPILLLQDDIREAAMELYKISVPELVLLIAVVSATYGWFPIKKLMNRGYKLPVINGYSMLFGGIAAFVTSFIFEGITTNSVYHFWPFVGWLLLLILLSNVIFYNMYGWLLTKYSFTFLSFAGFLCPIFGGLFGWLFLSEPISWHHGISLAMVTIGLYLFYREEFGERFSRKVNAS